MGALSQSGREELARRATALLLFWDEHGRDPEHGGWHSQLHPDGRPVAADHKRLLVQTRMLYALSAAARRRFYPGALERAETLYEWLIERGWDERRGGFCHSFTPDGRPLDSRRDLYGHAFAIFALEHFARASGRAEPRARARRIWALLCEHLADAEQGGFFEAGGPDWRPLHETRRQDPHMHLVEALGALGERDEALRLIGLCAARFVDSGRGCLRECFDAHWQPHPERGRAVSPGHHFEWVWLLHAYGGAAEHAIADRLWAFARRHGVDRDGLVFDELDVDGAVVRASKRLWPQTEHWKAASARGEALDPGPVLAAYADPESGGWREQLDERAQPLTPIMNATSVYHVIFAIDEVLHGVAGAEAASR